MEIDFDNVEAEVIEIEYRSVHMSIKVADNVWDEYFMNWIDY